MTARHEIPPHMTSSSAPCRRRACCSSPIYITEYLEVPTGRYGLGPNMYLIDFENYLRSLLVWFKVLNPSTGKYAYGQRNFWGNFGKFSFVSEHFYHTSMETPEESEHLTLLNLYKRLFRRFWKNVWGNREPPRCVWKQNYTRSTWYIIRVTS